MKYDFQLPEYVPEILIASAGQQLDWGHNFADIADMHKITRGEGAVIFVLDTAGEFVHADLTKNARNDLGANFTSDSTSEDKNGHGTHCAGIAAAADNSFGCMGVAPDAVLVPVKVISNRGGGAYSWIIQAIHYVADLVLPDDLKGKKKIINLSLSGSSNSERLQAAIDYAIEKGCFVIAAAGNAGVSQSGTIGYPAKIPVVISVGALDSYSKPASFSSNGKEIDVAAPGVGIYSAYPPQIYAYLNGTSMAAPFVAGFAALLVSALSEIKHQFDLMGVLKKCCTDAHTGGFDDRTGYGTIKAGKFVEYIEKRRKETGEDEPTADVKNTVRAIFPEPKYLRRLPERILLNIGEVLILPTREELTKKENRDLIGAVLFNHSAEMPQHEIAMDAVKYAPRERGEIVGTKETEDVLKFITNAVEVVKLAKADGKIDINDAGLLFGLTPSALAAFQNGQNIPVELADLSQDEIDYLSEIYGASIQNENVRRALYGFAILADAVADEVRERREFA